MAQDKTTWSICARQLAALSNTENFQAKCSSNLDMVTHTKKIGPFYGTAILEPAHSASV